jgi:hypothetical protein
MGRRSRARARAGDPPARPAGGGLARALNPIKVPTRARTRNGAIAFAVAAAVFAVLDWTTGNAGFRAAVVPLAILAVLWTIRALTMPPDRPDGERDAGP